MSPDRSKECACDREQWATDEKRVVRKPAGDLIDQRQLLLTGKKGDFKNEERKILREGGK